MRKKVLITIGVLLSAFIVILLVLNIWLNNQKSKKFEATPEELEKLEFYKKPESWFVDNLKNPQISIDGQTLNPKFQYMFEQEGDTSDKSLSIFKGMLSTSLGRKFIRNEVDREWTLYTKVTKPMEKTIDLEIPSRDEYMIPIRIYVPKTSRKHEKLPVLVYAHGGGYLFGSIKALDRAVQLIANEAEVIVVSIDYRLAPEYPYPAQSDDGEDVYLWVQKHIAEYNGNPNRIAFGGDSGGGHISINVAQRQLIKGNNPPTVLLLYYPATGLPFDDKSNMLFGKGFGLDTQFFEYLLTQVFPDQSLETAQPDQFMAPILSENLSGMPPTIIATSGFDILRDSGKRFAEKLKADSVDVYYFNYPSLTHSFLQFSGIIEEAEMAAVNTAQLLGEKIRE